MALRQPIQVLQLSPAGNWLAIACGSTIQILDAKAGQLKYTSPEQDSHKAGFHIRQIVWWNEEKLVSSGDDKILKEWQFTVDDDKVNLTLKEQRDIPKRANNVSISQDGQVVVVADKFGDVYAFPMHGCEPNLPTPPTASFPQEPEASTSASPAPQIGEEYVPGKGNKRKKVGILKDNTHGPQWRHVPAKVAATTPVLGHVSVLTAMILLDDQETGKGKIVTADRDEHIRVSQWPKGWEIERFLLGQRKFVSALALHPAKRNFLLSAGGDDHLRLWDMQNYECISKNISLEALKGTAEIKVEFEAPSDAKKLRRKAQIAKRKQDRAAKANGPAEDTKNGDEVTAEQEEEKVEAQNEEPAKPKVKVKQLDLAIRKMLFVGFGAVREDEDSLLVLSGVGSSALLAYRASDLLKPAEVHSSLQSQLVKLDYPILDITTIPSKRHLWVTLDVSSTDKAEEASPLRCFEVSGDGQLVFTNHPTLKTLNEECGSAISPSKPYPKTADLYPEIALLSKEPLGEDGITATEAEEEQADEPPASKKSKPENKEIADPVMSTVP